MPAMPDHHDMPHMEEWEADHFMGGAKALGASFAGLFAVASCL